MAIIPRSRIVALALGISALGAIFFVVSRADWSGKRLPAPVPGAHPPEIQAIIGLRGVNEQVPWYRKLIERVGPLEAQEALLRSGLPFTGETHLLNHTVGDYLYARYGVGGLTQCKDYFLSSCYHGFVLRAIGAGGMPEVARVITECRKGGVPVVHQCSHAVGHGFLASVGYAHLTKALELCGGAKRAAPDLGEFNCEDGVFMENVWGVHDGQPSPDRWVKEADPNYPCSDPRIPTRYVRACWSNQPMLLYQRFDRDVGKVGLVCEGIKNQEHREMCFHGLARQIHPIAAASVEQTLALCGLLPGDWPAFCVAVNASAGISVGDRDFPFLLCAAAQTDGKEQCYRELVSGLQTYYGGQPETRRSLCTKIRDGAWRERCLAESP